MRTAADRTRSGDGGGARSDASGSRSGNPRGRNRRSRGRSGTRRSGDGSSAEQPAPTSDGARGGGGGGGTKGGDGGSGTKGGGKGGGGKGGGKGGRRRAAQANRRGRNRETSPQQEIASFWGDTASLPSPKTDVRITDDPAAVPRSLGTPPLPGQEALAGHYFAAVYDRAVATAGALAAAGGLIDPEELGGSGD